MIFLLVTIAHRMDLLADPPALNDNAAGVMRLRPGSNGIILRKKSRRARVRLRLSRSIESEDQDEMEMPGGALNTSRV
jgi:hypothetical protein